MDTNHKQPAFPWYKKRLQNNSAPNMLPSGGLWRHADESPGGSCPLLSRTKSSVSPVLFHGALPHTSSQALRKKPSKEHACFSKQMIQKQIRREYVESIERKLIQRPLTLYPHYKDNMSPELFDKVLSVLEPDSCSDSTSGGVAFGPAVEEVEEHSTEPNQEGGMPVRNNSPQNSDIPPVKKESTKKGRRIGGRRPSPHRDAKFPAASKTH